MKKLILILVLAAGGYAAWYYRPAPPENPAARGGKGGKPGDMPPVPVVFGKVEKKDIPLYLDGLGNVQGFNTVVVRTRVDGQLEKVAFTEGQDVHVGDLLAKIDPKPFQAALEQAEAKQKQDEAQLANGKLDLARDVTLVQQKAAPQKTLDTQQALVATLEATVKADAAAVDSTKVQLSYTTISAPIDGRVGLRLVDQGNVVHATDLNGLVTITQLKPIAVIFTLPEKNLPAIQRELGASKLKVVAVGRDNAVTLGEGELAVVDNQIDMTTGTIKLKAIFANDQLHLWPGQFINARLLLTTRKDGLVVPASTIQRGPDNTYVFVVDEDQAVAMRPVTVEQFQDDLALIKEGLQAGERVVVDGQYRLQPGSHVKPAGAGKPGGGSPVGSEGGKPAGSTGGKPDSAGPPGEDGKQGDKPHTHGTGKPKSES